MQQQYRDVLEAPPVSLKRWEIGEIASRIGQLYYIYYLKSSEISYLNEAYTFYSAIRTRGYFKTEGVSEMMMMTSLAPISVRGASMTSSVTSPHAVAVTRDLRYQARYLMVCLLLGVSNDVIEPLLTDLGLTLVKYKTECRPALAESSQWKSLIEETKRFLVRRSVISIREDNGNKIPLLESGRLRPLSLDGLLLRPTSSMTSSHTSSPPPLRLGSALLIGNKRRNVIKVSELPLDVLRMAHSLEVSFNAYQQLQHQAELRGSEPFRNPQKTLLYQCTPAAFHMHMAAATAAAASSSSSVTSPGKIDCEKAVYLYVSSDPVAADGSVDTDVGDGSIAAAAAGLRMGAEKGKAQEGLAGALIPEDIVPYTRVPMLVVVEADAAEPFLAMKTPYGKPFLCLVAPKVWESATEPGLFTLFLHRPVAAFCILCGLFTPEKAIYEQCTIIINDYFAKLKEIIASYNGK